MTKDTLLAANLLQTEITKLTELKQALAGGMNQVSIAIGLTRLPVESGSDFYKLIVNDIDSELAGLEVRLAAL